MKITAFIILSLVSAIVVYNQSDKPKSEKVLSDKIADNNLVNQNLKQFEEFVPFEFDSKINGFDVSGMALLLPKNSENVAEIAILQFSKNGKSKFINTDYFFLSYNSDDLGMESSGGQEKIILHYEPIVYNQDSITLGSNQFEFFDIDFDGVDELLVAHYQMGQRGINTYSAFEIDDFYNTESYQYSNYHEKEVIFPKLLDYFNVWDLSSELANSLFLDFDEYTIFNKETQEITFRGSGGWCGGGSETFKLINNKFELTQIIKYEWGAEIEGVENPDVQDCYRLDYEIYDGQKVLKSTTKMN